MAIKQLLIAGVLLVALVGATGVAAADSHHEACPEDNPGQGLYRSTEASDGTSLENARKGIGRAVEAVGCDESFASDAP